MAKRLWIAFTSRTGTELREISKKLGTAPDYVCTNNLTLDPKLFKGSTVIQDKASKLFDFIKTTQNPIITLHGFMRIVPEDICNKFEILNGHPGMIQEYPELKGMDPQRRAIELGHSHAGCVIHEVTPGVDEGRILAYTEPRLIKPNDTEESLSIRLREDSIDLWVRFLSWGYKL